ncbi:hypothetical protein PG995_010539 [Apiospora arundinis]
MAKLPTTRPSCDLLDRTGYENFKEELSKLLALLATFVDQKVIQAAIDLSQGNGTSNNMDFANARAPYRKLESLIRISQHTSYRSRGTTSWGPELLILEHPIEQYRKVSKRIKSTKAFIHGIEGNGPFHDVTEAHMRQAIPNTNLCSEPSSFIRMNFGKGRLYEGLSREGYPADYPPERHGATPTISLAHLLENGFLRDKKHGGAFNPLDKAALALSLGRCLVHYFHGHLMRLPWSADNIYFLHQYKDSQHWLFNIHHPYVTCRTRKETKEVISDDILDRPVNPGKCQAILCSFARLLLEIENGHRIAISGRVRSDLKRMNNKVTNNRRNYRAAIGGCIIFTKHLESVTGRQPTLYDVRKVLYKKS